MGGKLLRTFYEHLEVSAALMQLNENIDIRRMGTELYVTFHECGDKQEVERLFAHYGMTIKRTIKDKTEDIYTASDYTGGHNNFFMLTAYVPIKKANHGGNLGRLVNKTY